MKKKENRLFSFFAEYGISFVLFGVIAAFCISGLQSTDVKQQEESLRIAEESILRGAVRCYAQEGMYPPDYDYLKENYGVRVDEDRFTVFYSIFASNMMPDVTVIEK